MKTLTLSSLSVVLWHIMLFEFSNTRFNSTLSSKDLIVNVRLWLPNTMYLRKAIRKWNGLFPYTSLQSIWFPVIGIKFSICLGPLLMISAKTITFPVFEFLLLQPLNKCQVFVFIVLLFFFLYLNFWQPFLSTEYCYHFFVLIFSQAAYIITPVFENSDSYPLIH